jgi:aminoglycoside phosphotransferase (APT) family kinase protein
MALSSPRPPPELAPVRTGEELDERVLEAYLKGHIPGLDGKIDVLQFPGGHANLTYQVRFGDRELVLRRPPLGPVAPRSHDMAREYRVLAALQGRFSAAPRVYLLCEDSSVIGATFVVMERCHGTVPRGSVPADLDALPNARQRMSWTLIDTLAELHSVDYEAAGLADLGRPEGFVARQVRGWKQRWDAAKNVDLAAFDRHYEWLMEHLPAESGGALVHNDYKFDNTMFERGNPDRIVAVLDWDMATLGDPLMDLGTLLGYWRDAGDAEERGATDGAAMTAQPGFPTRAQLADRYARRRGIDVASIAWYEAFAIWKIAVIIQQIYIRYLRGQTQDARFRMLGARVAALVELARSVARA